MWFWVINRNVENIFYKPSQMCVISGFHCKVDENCALMGFYAESSGTGCSVTQTSTVFITDVLQFCQEEYLCKPGVEPTFLVY
jgi:hypothetical protein